MEMCKNLHTAIGEAYASQSQSNFDFSFDKDLGRGLSGVGDSSSAILLNRRLMCSGSIKSGLKTVRAIRKRPAKARSRDGVLISSADTDGWEPSDLCMARSCVFRMIVCK